LVDAKVLVIRRPAHVNVFHMSWRKEGRRSERGYHHGNLKEALLQAALDLIAQKGAAGFTFADAARMAGVSPAAPYRHFRDRDELLSSIAQRGFEQFEAALSTAWDDGRPDTVTAFERVGRAYLAFAREEPSFYSAMFESGLPLEDNPTLMAAGERAFAVIRAAAERLAALAPPGVPRPPAMMMALHIWTMSHGVASLFARGDAARRKLPMSPDELLEAEVLIYLRGLGFQTDRRPDAAASAAGKPSGPPPIPPDASPSATSGPWGKPK
jgi:AcrR family transcriptional regulator